MDSIRCIHIQLLEYAIPPRPSVRPTQKPSHDDIQAWYHRIIDLLILKQLAKILNKNNNLVF